MFGILNSWKFRRDAKGNTSLIFALGAIPLVLAIGAAVDTGRAFRARTLLQGATDAAAIAAASSGNLSESQMTALVEAYLAANGTGDVLHQIGKISVVPDRVNGTTTVSIKGYVQTSLMGVIGVDRMEVSAQSEVSMGSQSLEVALALDNTGSMAGPKIAALISSATLLVDELSGGASNSFGLKIGVVPFAQYVNVGNGNINAGWMNVPPRSGGKNWSGCVGARSSPQDETVAGSDPYPGILNVNCPATITPLTSNLNQVRVGIKKMVASGSTYIPGGLLWGWNILESAEPFTEAMTDAQRKQADGRRVLVLMTDGENTVVPTYPDLATFMNDPVAKAYSDGRTKDICTGIKAKGIDLFTVAFQVSAAETKRLLRDCASDPGMAFDATDATALKDAFRKISVKLASLRISK